MLPETELLPEVKLALRDPEVGQFSQGSVGLLADAKALAVFIPDGATIEIELNSYVQAMRDATDMLGYVASTKKKAEEKRKSLVGPFNAGVKQINDWFKQLLAPAEEADAILRPKLLMFQREHNSIKASEEERLRKLQEKLQAKIEKQAEKAGLPIPPPPPLPVVAPTITGVSAALGQSITRKVWKWEVSKEADVPREYLAVDEKGISQAVRDGVRQIPGIRIYQEEQLTIRTS